MSKFESIHFGWLWPMRSGNNFSPWNWIKYSECDFLCIFQQDRVHKLLHIFLQQLNCRRHSVAVWAKYLRPIYQFLSKIGGILFGCRDWGEKGCLCAKCQNELGKLRFAVNKGSLSWIKSSWSPILTTEQDFGIFWYCKFLDYPDVVGHFVCK